MKRNVAIVIIAGLLCMFTSGCGAEDQPEKRVMNFLAVMDLKCGGGIKNGQ